MKLYQKIALQAFLKEGGIFKAPPQLIKDVASRVVESYAENAMAILEEKENLHTKKSHAYFQIKNRLESGKYDALDHVKRLSSSGKGGGHKNLHMFRRDKGLQFLIESNEEGSSFYYAFREKGSKRDLNRTGPFTAKEMKREIELIYDKNIREVQRKIEDIDIVEYQLAIKELKQYAKKAVRNEGWVGLQVPIKIEGWEIIDRLLVSTRKELESTLSNLNSTLSSIESNFQGLDLVGDTFSVRIEEKDSLGISVFTSADLKYTITKINEDALYKIHEFDRKYKHEKERELGSQEAISFLEQKIEDAQESIERSLGTVDIKSVQDKIKYLGLDWLDIHLDFNGIPGAAGSFDKSNMLMKIDTEFKGTIEIEELISTIEHECQHVGQFLISKLRGLHIDDAAGFPSNNKNQKEDYFGFVRVDDNSEKKERKEHALRGVEFYTRLTDEIDDFTRNVRKVPNKFRRDAARMWVGDLSNDSAFEEEFNSQADRSIQTAHFFKALKEHDFDRWKKAVKEFMSDLSSKNII